MGGGFLFELDIAALWSGDESVLNLARDAVVGVGEKRGKFVFEVVSLIGLADKVEHGETLLVFGEAQAAAELLQEDRQRFGGAKEEDGVDLGDVDAFVIDIDDEDEADFAIDQALLGGSTFVIRRLAGQTQGRDATLLEKIAHEIRVLDRDAEAETFYFVDVRDVLEKR